MRYRYLSLVAAGVLAAATWPAWAQEGSEEGIQAPSEAVDTAATQETAQEAAPQEAPSEAVQPVEPEEQPEVVREARPYDIGLALGGGVMNFTGAPARRVTDVGGAWDAHLIFGVNRVLAFEAAYKGSANGVDTLGISSSAVLLSNGVGGALRLNFAPRSAITPYVSGGAGWRHYTLTNSSTNVTAISDLNDSDDVLEVPAAIGLAFRSGGFFADARGGYNFSFYDNLLVNPSTPNADVGAGLDNWSATLTLGAVF